METKRMRKKWENKKFCRHIFTFALALALLFAPVQTVWAAAAPEAGREIPAVSYYGQARQFVFTPGTAENPGDLFDMFKGLMPGDVREQEITLCSAAQSGAPINLFLRAYVPALGANATKEQRELADKANALLRKLTITVSSDEFTDQPMLDAGAYPEQGMGDWVFLGRFAYDTESLLRVHVSVPAVLEDETYSDNDFQDVEAVVRWAFLVEEFDEDPVVPVPPDDPVPDNPGPDAPAPGGDPGGEMPPDAPVVPGGVTPAAPGAVTPVTPGGGVQPGAAAQPPQGDPGNADAPEVEDLEDPPAPLAPPDDEVLGLEDDPLPLAGPVSMAWALLNLILAIVTVLASAILLLLGLKKYRDEKEEEKDTPPEQVSARDDQEEDDGEEARRRKVLLRLCSILPAAGSVIAFLLTEDMSLPMIFVDRWTWLMVLIAVVQAVICILVFWKRKEKEDEDDLDAGKEA